MKKILGLDLGTNSIGWALTNNDFDNKLGNIEGLGSRIIPMSQDVLGKFDSGVSISQTAERTKYRGTRRLVQRFLLRRERLHRVLNVLDFLPQHYAEAIDFEKKFGQFKPEKEEKLSFYKNENGKNQFIFLDSHQEMLAEFQLINTDLKQVPYDWTIYYLRKKALTQKISKEELAWILLNFNQKRGYYQLRGEEQEDNKNKLEEFHTLTVVDVIEREKGKSGIWYNVILENGWIYKRESKIALFDWIGKQKNFIVTTELNDDGTVKLNKDNEEKRSFRSPKEDDWGLVKIRTEQTINQSEKSVGTFIYDALLKNPNQKIKGELVRTIERKFYKDELSKILKAQIAFHHEIFGDRNLYKKCIDELYRHNDSHKNNIKDKSFEYLFLEDIIFFQRPLKSKTSLISDCSLEFVPIKDENGILVKDDNGKQVVKPLKCIAKSNPIFQEFRLLQFVKNLKIYKKEIVNDVDVTHDFIKTEEDLVELFNFLNDRKEIDQISLIKHLLRPLKLKGKLLDAEVAKLRWNFVEDKIYPCNETRNQFLNAVAKIDVDKSFFDAKNTQDLWHILYSVTDKIEITKAITTFAKKHNLPDEFITNFSKLKPYKKDYGSFSEKAIKKLLPLMRFGSYWKESNIDIKTLARIDKIQTGEFDENMRTRVREKAIHLSKTTDFQGLPLWLASYIIYDRHSEASDVSKWKTPADIQNFLKYDFKQHSLRNPIVEQVITETLRVVKDIWQHYGDGKENFFTEIHIELGREMKNDKATRERMTKKISENENTNLRIKAILTELKNDGLNDIRPYSPSQQEILKIYEEGVYSSEIKKEKLEEIDKIRKNAKPTPSEIIKYKLWLEQGYISPYTGKLIPLSELFTTKYQIEHIIPQSRLFDDSLSNKVICESEVNELKSNMTAYEFIQNNEDRIVILTGGKTVKIFTKDAYNQHITAYYSKNKSKQKRLLSEEISEKFIERQLNDTKYISKIVKNLLSRIVREEEEQEVTSKHIVSLNGSITSRMKQDWGLNDVWNNIITPRFERLNALTNSNDFGQFELKKDAYGNKGKQIFQTTVPDAIAKGFTKKRIDHRHHALDALVIACVSRTHINYLNNLNARDTDDKAVKHELRNKLCFKTKPDSNGNYKWEFYKPWKDFTTEAEDKLNTTIVSFKQNTRVINKTVNKYTNYKDEKGNLNIGTNGLVEKKIITQTKGDNWAIRKPMHAETVSGKVFLKRIKQSPITIANAIEQIEFIVDKEVKKQLASKIKQYPNNMVGLKKHLKAFPVMIDGKVIDKVQIYETIEATATRKTLDITFDEKKIEKITDTGIQKILLNHLKQEMYQNAIHENGEKIPAHEVAFSENGLDELNKNLTTLNNGKKHQPIKKVRVFEESNKFPLGETGNKKNKFVETAKGTNLFFAIYQDDLNNKKFITIPLNVVIQNLKDGLSPVPDKYLDNKTKVEYKLTQFLSPNDLVYTPTNDELENSNQININNFNKDQVCRLYNVNDFSGYTIYFTPNQFAKNIAPKELDTSFDSKLSKSLEGITIKENFWKLEVDRLGKIKKIIR
ncbi:TPA: type II CRISPR RNA-guided endonuclease Cas9 [Flavobacterium psychrophilum]|uniref:type II CRISPR RNA-guided endonuclease Cas9 n=2 Tax=Flavobacterium psychrophilum TaxID=96345 RepID=UPI000B7C2309|nr:type II CRISPR RNA-guided endonuclease Cas9 [Flavobacterium psychrophilum]GEJ52845.1 CRISPR-associated endonuclease Cas9 [Flavobacterium psychrophilum]GEJ54756.1 CRISPR-associated endonuclease Cas9 [Flavobacterium psychrophilum]SNB97255.1 CRISPR-associated protein, Csn1 family [Flavobacterium psychrophilum]